MYKYIVGERDKERERERQRERERKRDKEREREKKNDYGANSMLFVGEKRVVDLFPPSLVF